MGNYELRNFMIFNMSEIDKINFSEILETSAQTLRLSIDSNKSFIKWDMGITPSFIESLTTKEGPYTYSEMITILSSGDWVSNDEII
jgi:hypothetical protein